MDLTPLDALTWAARAAALAYVGLVDYPLLPPRGVQALKACRVGFLLAVLGFRLGRLGVALSMGGAIMGLVGVVLGRRAYGALVIALSVVLPFADWEG